MFVGLCFPMRMRLQATLDSIRLSLAGLVLVGTVSNRTFFAWLSSGLETALFYFGIAFWASYAWPLARADARNDRC